MMYRPFLAAVVAAAIVSGCSAGSTADLAAEGGSTPSTAAPVSAEPGPVDTGAADPAPADPSTGDPSTGDHQGRNLHDHAAPVPADLPTGIVPARVTIDQIGVDASVVDL